MCKSQPLTFNHKQAVQCFYFYSHSYSIYIANRNGEMQQKGQPQILSYLCVAMRTESYPKLVLEHKYNEINCEWNGTVK